MQQGFAQLLAAGRPAVVGMEAGKASPNHGYEEEETATGGPASVLGRKQEMGSALSWVMLSCQ